MRKNLKSTVQRLLAAMLMLVLVVTVMPVPAEAAVASIRPRAVTTFVGASFQLKVTGSYKKVSYKAENKNVTVSKSGKVTGKKAGGCDVYATITLKNGRKVKSSCFVEILSAGEIVKVSEADDASAEQIKDYLDSTTPFSIVYYGGKDEATKIVNKLREKVGKLNEYGVLFQYDKYGESTEVEAYPVDYKPQKKGYIFRVTSYDCKLYKYSVKFYKRLVQEAMIALFADDIDDNYNITFLNDGKLAFARKFNTYQEYEEALEEYSPWEMGEDGDYYLKDNCDELPDYAPSYGAKVELRMCWLVANTKFCDLSQAMKMWVIDRAGFFGAGTTLQEKEEYNIFGMSYAETDNGPGSSNHQSDMVRMRIMSENKADGVCHDYANYAVTAMTQLGIDIKYDSDGGHAWTVIRPYNSDGKKLKYILDNTLYYDDGSIYDRHLSSESEIY